MPPKNVFGPVDQLRTLLDQCVAAARLGRMDRARNGEHIASRLQGQPCGDQRARLKRSFDDQGAARHASDDSVADREILGSRRGTQRELADDEAFGCDAMRELTVLLRVDAVEAGADHGNGAARTVQTACMRSGVDAECQSRDDRPAGLAQMARERAPILGPLPRRIAAADHGDGLGMQ